MVEAVAHGLTDVCLVLVLARHSHAAVIRRAFLFGHSRKLARQGGRISADWLCRRWVQVEAGAAPGALPGGSSEWPCGPCSEHGLHSKHDGLNNLPECGSIRRRREDSVPAGVRERAGAEPSAALALDTGYRCSAPGTGFCCSAPALEPLLCPSSVPQSAPGPAPIVHDGSHITACMVAQ